MGIGLADTSVFIAHETGRPLGDGAPEELAVSVITVGELRWGVLMADDPAVRHRRMRTLELVGRLEPLPVDDAVADAWAGLVAQLRQAGQRMGVNDSWIAATAIAHDLPLVTQDAGFENAPGLNLISV